MQSGRRRCWRAITTGAFGPSAGVAAVSAAFATSELRPEDSTYSAAGSAPTGGAVHEGQDHPAAFLANLGIAIAKFAGFLITGASSMLAESIHSLADTTNQGLLVLCGKQAARPATPEHPFGYGRDRYFWAFVVAMVLFLVGGLFAVYEGISKLRDPHEISSPGVAFAILGVAVVLELFSLRTAVRGRASAGRSLGDLYPALQSPELPVVLLEDQTCWASVRSRPHPDRVTGDPAWDGRDAHDRRPAGLIAVIWSWNEEPADRRSATSEHEGAIGRHRAPDVRGLIHMHAAPGPGRAAGGRQIDLPDLTAGRIAAAIDRPGARAQPSIARVIYLEPDLREPSPQAPGSAGA
jgi:hypothetical protein